MYLIEQLKTTIQGTMDPQQIKLEQGGAKRDRLEDVADLAAVPHSQRMRLGPNVGSPMANNALVGSPNNALARQMASGGGKCFWQTRQRFMFSVTTSELDNLGYPAVIARFQKQDVYQD